MDVTYEVTELAAEVAKALRRAFPDEVWVRGQIRNISRPASGHVYFSLIDIDATEDSATAQLPVTLFASDKMAVNRLLTRAGAGRMDDGVAVRIRGVVDHYANVGKVQLRMTWIDTDFTLGQLAAARAALLRRLAADGHLNRNRGLPLPALPLSVGLVTSLGSAAHADFLATLRASGWAFRVSEVDTRVQGTEAPASIAASVVALQGKVDVIAIVRGGGSALDLAAFDAEVVAVAIATSSVPVVTGIGHEVDAPVAGQVAFMAAKTPTAAAQYLVQRIADAALALNTAAEAVSYRARRGLQASRQSLDQRTRATVGSSRIVIRAARSQLDRSASRIGPVSQLVLQRHRAGVDSSARALGPSTSRSVLLAAGRLDGIASRVAGLDPRRLFDRGWSVTRDRQGRVVRAATDVEDGAELRTTVSQGEIISRVEVK